MRMYIVVCPFVLFLLAIVLFFFDIIRILIIPLVSSNTSYTHQIIENVGHSDLFYNIFKFSNTNGRW